MADEVKQGLIGELHLLEHEDDRSLLGETFKQDAPG